MAVKRAARWLPAVVLLALCGLAGRWAWREHRLSQAPIEVGYYSSLDQRGWHARIEGGVIVVEVGEGADAFDTTRSKTRVHVRVVRHRIRRSAPGSLVQSMMTLIDWLDCWDEYRYSGGGDTRLWLSVTAPDGRSSDLANMEDPRNGYGGHQREAILTAIQYVADHVDPEGRVLVRPETLEEATRRMEPQR